MDPRDIIYFTEYRIERFRQQRAHDKLVQIAKQNPSRPAARIFRLFPSRRRQSDITTD
jgi:hypothetical protein